MSDLPAGLVGTGVFATEDEGQTCLELAERAAKTPVILLFGKHDLSGDAWKKAHETAHGFALAHGLPDIQGYYGLGEDREFIKQAGQ